MTDLLLFPFTDYRWFYAGFTAFVLLVLALDLGVFHRDAHAVTAREAATWSVVWVLLALVFNYFFYRYMLWHLPQMPALAGLDHGTLARDSALEFLAGYVVEKALAVDNVFVFVAVFSYFAVPAIFALTNEPMIVFTSNIFAILGLRAMYFLLANAVRYFTYLKYGLGLILVFVGLKMVWLNQAFGGKFPISWSLGIIGAILALSMLVSVATRRRTLDAASGA